MRAVLASLPQDDSQILAHQSTAKPKSNLPWFIVRPRFSICRIGSPFEITSRNRLDVETGSLPEMDTFGEALDETGDADLVDHLGELA